MSEEVDEGYYCAICQSDKNLKTCSRCKMVFYCSPDHQKQHWPSHKIICVERERPKTTKVEVISPNKKYRYVEELSSYKQEQLKSFYVYNNITQKELTVYIGQYSAQSGGRWMGVTNLLFQGEDELIVTDGGGKPKLVYLKDFE